MLNKYPIGPEYCPFVLLSMNSINLFATGVTIPEDCVTACIGPMTAKTLQDFDVKPDVVADVHDVNGLAKSIVGYYQT